MWEQKSPTLRRCRFGLHIRGCPVAWFRTLCVLPCCLALIPGFQYSAHV